MKIECNNISFDFDDACKELASIFARAKLEEAIENNIFDSIDAPIGIKQMDYLMDEYFQALGYYANHTPEYIKHLVDLE